MAEPDQDFFQSVPWCEKLLVDPDFIITPTIARQYKASTEDALLAETLKTEDTIRACISFYRRPNPGVGYIEEVHMLLHLGFGLNGHAHVCHGGIVATLIDDTMGSLLVLNRNLEGSPVQLSTSTASLNLSFLKPVATPQIVLVTAKFREIKGRKFYIESEVKDGNAVVLAKGNALWIAVQDPRGKL